jgi:O-antigen/teichoic acid export membrane protein
LKTLQAFLLKNNKYAYTFAGNIVPLLAGFLTVPFTVKHFGVEVVGFIAICWLMVGYSGIFDLGLSRSMTQMVSSLLPSLNYNGIRKYFWTTFIMSFLFSLLITILIYHFSSDIIYLFNISNHLADIGVESFKLLSFSVPFILLTSVLIGFLTSYNSFNTINIIKIPIGIFMMLAPVISYYLNLGVIGIIYILLITRVLNFICYFFIIFSKYTFLRKIDVSLYGLKNLLNQGLWMTLSNIISPLIVNFDRFVLGSIISVQAVAYYSTVYDIVSKLHIIPTTFVTVLFPLFAYNSSFNDKTKNSLLIGKYLFVVILISSPIIFITDIWAFDLISIWINPDFANKSYKIAMILLIGVLWNTLAQIPFTFLQANGNSSKTALFHIIELIIFLPILYFLIVKFGIVGAAIAWSFRVILDFILLIIYSFRITKKLLDISICFFPVLLSIFLGLVIIIDSNNKYFKVILTILISSIYLYFFNKKKYIFYEHK